MAKVTSVQNYIDTIEDRFVPAASRGVTFTVQYALVSLIDMSFTLILTTAPWQHPWRHPSPDVTIASTGEDFVALVNETSSAASERSSLVALSSPER